MKHILITIIVVVSLVYACKPSTTSEQQANMPDVPELVQKRYKMVFPEGKNPKWELEKGRFEVTFMQHGSETSAVFDSLGSVEKTETIVDLASLPDLAKQFIADSVYGEITEVSIVIDAYGNTMYQAEVNGQDYLFANNGVLLGLLPKDDGEDEK
jgi:hypothetical protein